jgi:cytochrome c556
MNKLFFILLAVGVLASPASFAAGKSKQKPSTKAIRKEMNSISGLVREMGPFIASEQEFVKDTNKNVIQKTLEELAKSFKNLANKTSRALSKPKLPSQKTVAVIFLGAILRKSILGV